MQADLGIYFSDPKVSGYPFNKRGYKQAYFDLLRRLRKTKVRAVIVRGKKSYLGRGRFAYAWELDQATQALKKIKGPVNVGKIFNRGGGKSIFLKEKKLSILNHPVLDEICTNKWLTYKYFAKFSPYTKLVKNPAQLKATLGAVPGSIAFTKPLDGEDCLQVYAGPKEEIATLAKKLKYPRLVQECIDTRGGLPGVCKSRHDLRVFMLNGKPSYSEIRIIQDSKERVANIDANVDRCEVALKKVPNKVLRLVTAVDKQFKEYWPRAYAVDVGWDSKLNAPRLIELNARVGLPQPEYSWYKKALNAYFKFLTSTI